MKRSVLLSGFLAALIVLLGAAYLSLPWVVSWGVRGYLEDLGFAGARISTERLGLTQSSFVDFGLGPKSGVRARRIVIDYSPARLLGGVLASGFRGLADRLVDDFVVAARRGSGE